MLISGGIDKIQTQFQHENGDGRHLHEPESSKTESYSILVRCSDFVNHGSNPCLPAVGNQGLAIHGQPLFLWEFRTPFAERGSTLQVFWFFFSALTGAALAHSGRDAQSGQEPPLDEEPDRDHDHQYQQIFHFFLQGSPFFKGQLILPIIRKGSVRCTP